MDNKPINRSAKLFITGGTGLVGESLIPELLLQGHQVTVLTRNADNAKQKLGDKIHICTSLDSLQSLDGYDAVINLAGESIAGKRWSKEQKRILGESRWAITQKLTSLIQMSVNPPQIYISGSAIGYYGTQSDNVIDENTVAHDEFTHRLCKQWEEYALAAESEKTKVCILRTAVVLAKKGGMLPKLITPFKLGAGAVMGNGKQFFSWIHIDDMVQIICFLLSHPQASGAFNLSSPQAVSNEDFSRKLAKVLHRPCLFRIPAFILSLLMGETAVLVLGSQRVAPVHLLKMGYTFKHESLEDALADLLKED